MDVFICDADLSVTSKLIDTKMFHLTRHASIYKTSCGLLVNRNIGEDNNNENGRTLFGNYTISKYS